MPGRYPLLSVSRILPIRLNDEPDAREFVAGAYCTSQCHILCRQGVERCPAGEWAKPWDGRPGHAQRASNDPRAILDSVPLASSIHSGQRGGNDQAQPDIESALLQTSFSDSDIAFDCDIMKRESHESLGGSQYRCCGSWNRAVVGGRGFTSAEQLNN